MLFRSREEALAIALIMREALEEDEKTAALITNDRNLARRVATELERWDLQIDDSAGKPLTLTPIGLFVRLVAKICEDNFDRVNFLSLLKHPFTKINKDIFELKKQTRDLEKILWRAEIEDENLIAFEQEAKSYFKDFYELYLQKEVNFSTILKEHIKLCENLATGLEQTGCSVLWKGEAGEAASKFFAELFDKAELLGNVNPAEYLGVVEALMSGVTIRPRWGSHPRLSILGPIEARLNKFDVTILAF